VRVIQVAVEVWLVIDAVYRPRYLIVRGPAVNRRTWETHVMYRIDGHALVRAERRPLAWCETYAEAVSWCREQLETPEMAAPIRDGYGGAITPRMQRERWAAGLDPATGLPRER
jgi:hypothetical protein